MATSNKEEVVDKMNVEGDSDSEFDDTSKPGMEASASAKKLESVSMFCKNCLSPYRGAQKSGTFVLKCKNCGQTDTVLEEEATDLDPNAIVGNLMMNKFLHVIREQENTCINIGDPEFADDNYRELTAAMNDFCIYMNTIVERLLEIAKQERSAVELKISQPEQREKSGKSGEPDQAYPDNFTEVETGTVIADGVLQDVNVLRSSVLKVVALLIKKYKLPVDIWDSIEHRLRNPEASNQDSDESDDEEDKLTLEDFEIRNRDRNRDKSETCDDAENGNVNASGMKNEENGPAEREEVKHKVKDCAPAVNVESTDRDEDMKTVFGVDIKDVRATLDDEVFVKLGSKFKVCNNREAAEDTLQKEPSASSVDAKKTAIPDEIQASQSETRNKKNEEENDAEDAALDKEMLEKLGSKFTFHHEPETEFDSVLLSLLKNTQVLKDHVAAERIQIETVMEKPNEHKNADENECSIANTPDKMPTPHAKDTSEACSQGKAGGEVGSGEFEVNFHSVSTAFLSELQSRKRRALVKRKQKALNIVAAKMIAIKQQVMMVERQIRQELNSAYASKLQKAENQRQRLAEKQKDIETAEDLVHHYIQTGQNDKARELMRLVYSQNQNN